MCVCECPCETCSQFEEVFNGACRFACISYKQWESHIRLCIANEEKVCRYCGKEIPR